MLTITFCLEDGPKRYSKQRLFFIRIFISASKSSRSSPLVRAGTVGGCTPNELLLINV